VSGSIGAGIGNMQKSEGIFSRVGELEASRNWGWKE